MKKRIILFMLVFSLTIVCCPVNAAARSSTPIILDPVQYEDVPTGTTKIQWLAPSSGNVTKYIISVRELKVEDTTSNVLKVDKAETTSCYYNISSGKIKPKGLYRASVCAVLSDGTKKYSPERLFYGASHNGISSNSTISFKIYTGFETLTKEAIYYSASTVDSVLTSITGEIINTYPYSQGVSSTAYGMNNVSVIVPWTQSENDAPLMKTIYYYNSLTRKITEADIRINKAYPWGNGTASNFDIQNCMTHEMGHVAGVTDKYESFASEWTMYGRGRLGETKKRTLCEEDRAAIAMLYGGI